MRAALYARFSSEELQTSKSTDDQLHLCRRHAAAIGAEVAQEYADEGISGASMANRPAIQRLLDDARARRFEVVIAEDLDRLSRSDIDTLTLFDDLQALGVEISTPADPKVQRLHASLKGMVNGLFLTQLAAKVRRGHEGVVRSGRLIGRPPYGYRPLLRHDAAGERIRGLVEIDPAHAPVVEQVFTDYAAGLSPEAIAEALTAEGVPAPQAAKWNGAKLRGNPAEGVPGMLNTELYRGVIVYGGRRETKDRRTAKVTRRATPEASWLRVPAPELRIVSDALWEAVKARQAQVAEASAGRPDRARRPKRLLSGRVHCGCCGALMTVQRVAGKGRAYVYYACLARTRARGRQPCAMTRHPSAPDLEARVVAAMRERLLHPEMIEAAVREYHRLKHAEAKAGARGRAEAERDLAETERRLKRLVDQVEEGMPWSAVAARHGELTQRQAQLVDQLAALAPPAVLTVHPAAARKYREAIDGLAQALDRPHPDVAQAREAIRALVARVTVHPLAAYAQYDLAIDFDLAALLAPGAGRVGDNGALEPGRGPLTRTVPLRLRA